MGSAYARKLYPDEYRTTSQFTPLDHHFPALPINKVEDAKRDAIRKFQRSRLSGYTTRELSDLDAISSRKFKPSTFGQVILPLLQRTNWEVAPPADFRRTELYEMDANRGLWAASNEEVWQAVLPSLQIATRILMSMHLTPWFNALLLGRREPVNVERLPSRVTGQYTFDTTPANDSIEALRKRDEVFRLLQSDYKIKFGFRKHDEDITTRAAQKKGFAAPAGETISYFSKTQPRTADNQGKVHLGVYINNHVVEPLFRDDLDDAERYGLQLFIANTIVHEIMHCMNYPIRPDLKNIEPYFSSEPLAEIGFSMEQNVLGGTIGPFFSRPEVATIHLAYHLSLQWPKLGDYGASGSVQLRDPPLRAERRVYPVPVDLFENMQQDAFFSTAIRRFGWNMLHEQTRLNGVKFDLKLSGKLGTNGFPEAERSSPALARLQWNQLRPAERAFYTMAAKLEGTVALQEQFWNQTQITETCITLLMDLILEESSISFTGNLTTHHDSEYKQLDLAINAHSQAIDALLATELISGVQRPDRHDALLLWNADTRLFIYKMACEFVQPSFTPDMYPPWLEKIENELEICRLKLWAPGTSHESSSFNACECSALADALVALQEDDYPALLDCWAWLFNDERSGHLSVYARTFASVLGSKDATDFKSWTVGRKEAIARGRKRLLALSSQLGAVGRHPEWKLILADADREARKLERFLEQKPERFEFTR